MAIQSVLNQDFSDWELIICDNASADHTRNICEKFAEIDSRIKLLFHDYTIPAGENFAFTFEQSVSEYVVWICADDVWDMSRLSQMYNEIILYHSDIIYTPVAHIDSAGRQIRHIADGFNFKFPSKISLTRRLKYYFLPEFLGKSNCLYGLFPREAVRKNINYLVRGGNYGDSIFVFNILRNHTLASVGQPSLFKRIHVSAQSSLVLEAHEGPELSKAILRLILSLSMTLSLRGFMEHLRHTQTPFEFFLLIFFLPIKMIYSAICIWRYRLQ